VKAAEMREILSRYSLHLKRDLGQNFLVNEDLAARLVQLAGVEAGDCVIEVGTGLGCLTRALAARAQRVVTIEIDSGVVRALREDQLLPENVELIHSDALKVDLRELVERLGPRVRLVANLPYSVATPLLRGLLDLRDALLDWSVMLQSEVAERLLASCGSKAYGSFSVLHQLTVDATRQCELAPASFFPVPKVSSSFVRLTPRADSPVAADELALLERVARAAFGKRRKTIANSIRAAGLAGAPDPEAIARALAAAGIAANERAERVPPEQMLALARELAPSSAKAGS
jgi:16S rRNA (adenine1518-N6/adenine1519-N6)-dimethyltransferase